LAGRVRFETDLADLASLVTGQIDHALHPEIVAMLATGIVDGRMSPVTVEHGTIDAISIDGGIANLLRWSDEPLDIVLGDPRSPARRLPDDEIRWLEKTAVSLIVPVHG